MEHILEVTLLYDFYGELLTDKQKNIFELYYQNDLSLAEIGEQLKISRQGVYDTLKRTEHSLSQYEKTLQLVQRFVSNKHYIEEMINMMDEIENDLNNTQKIEIQVKKMKDIAKKILNV